MLACRWKDRQKNYDFVVVGSGYGGAITAARLAASDLTPKPGVCILERGVEWPVGDFPDTVEAVADAMRTDAHPMGLYEMLNYRDISVLKGCGLGGTSLINANVAATPDAEVFEQADWPRAVTFDSLQPWFALARETLGAKPHPKAWEFPKVEAMDRRAREIGTRAFALDLTINYEPTGRNRHGVFQQPCLCCGDCVTGCNHHSKNTLYMNYLPMARNAGAEIYIRTEVEWVENLPGGGWRVHGKNYDDSPYGTKFTLEATNVILAAGSINSTEILMRSEAHGLPVSPRVGTRFSANGDFFGVAYNGDHRTQVIGFGTHPDSPVADTPPGPSIVSGIHYNDGAPVNRRIQIEDLTFPSAYIGLARRTFASLRGEDTDTGDEKEERRRVWRDMNPFVPYQPKGALNHSMLYLVISFDDAQGRMIYETPWNAPNGRVRIVWDEAGRQAVYTRLNAELRRHARALGASFISNPVWSFLDIRHLLTAHPIGGCPMGEDYAQGAVDEFGRVFAADGQAHDGLFLADGAVLPSSLGVNPFLTISALAERIADRKIREMKGDPYPEPETAVSVPGVDPLLAARMEEPELERLFERRPSHGQDLMVNSGERSIDLEKRLIRNDVAWKGFFPRGHFLNVMSSALFTGFKKRFLREGQRLVGTTSDTDDRIRARNTLEEIRIDHRTGDLEPGEYVLLRYLDPPWQGFYDVFKVIEEDLLIGRVYLGEYPHGVRLFTFPMTRVYGLDGMTAGDHREFYEGAAVPTAEDLQGAWRMDVISNANQARGLAYLKFDLKPEGRLEARYQVMGLFEGLATPSFFKDHFRMDDFTPFRDEIRKLDRDCLIGKYVTDSPEGLSQPGGLGSLGLLHGEGQRWGFYYLLTRVDEREYPVNSLFRPFLEVQLPDGLGMTFDEEMVGWYLPGEHDPKELPAGDKPPDAADCSFRLRMTIRDLNEFVDGIEHEAEMKGTLSFGSFDGTQPVTFPVSEQRSFFRYLRVNPETGEAELHYHLRFQTQTGKTYTFDGRKYMQRDGGGGIRTLQEILDDYTTLYARVYENTPEQGRQIGAARLKFRTFEDAAAVGNLAAFLRSFRVTGTNDPLLQTQGALRFLAFTGQFLLREYDPLSPEG